MSAERVRITASTSQTTASGIAANPDTDPNTVYVSSLIRAQLRLALASVAGFLGVLTAYILILVTFVELDQWHLMGISLRWWLLGFGVYPLIFVTALIYAGAAKRNETRYQQLVGDTGS